MTHPPTDTPASPDLREEVRRGYAALAVSGSSCCGPAAACGSGPAYSPDELAERIGYSAEELRGLPEEANLGLSCGNPTALAALEAGEVVLDLGSGAGFDAFLAGPRVGATGRVLGVDMTPEMITRARRGLAAYAERTGLSNVEFRLGEIEHLPVADGSVDVVISNCVLNLSPDKPQVWREIARVLRPGGRVALSDMALLRPLPAEVARRLEAYVGCIAGAVPIEEMRVMIEAAGLAAVELRPKPEYVAAFDGFEDPLYREIVGLLPAGATAADYLTSVDVAARKG